MSIFKRALTRIDENRGNPVNCIPWGFSRFEEYLPGVIQKTYYIVTANSGVKINETYIGY